MALYAFDDTWNLDKPGTERDTNVVWFHEADAERQIGIFKIALDSTVI